MHIRHIGCKVFSSTPFLYTPSAQRTDERVAKFWPKICRNWHQAMASYSYGEGQNISCPLLLLKKLCWFKGHKFYNFTSINATIWKIIDVAGFCRWNLVWCIYLIPIRYHIKDCLEKSREKIQPLWPLWPSYDLLNNFPQLFYCLLTRFLSGTSLKLG